MKTLLTSVLMGTLLLTQACATQSHGRVAPLVQIERETLNCETLKYEHAKVNGFCELVQKNGWDGDSCAIGVASALVPVGILHSKDRTLRDRDDVAAAILTVAATMTLEAQTDDMNETLAALKSGSIRSAQLEKLAAEKGCELEERKACPPLCSKGPVMAILTMENGFC